MNDQVNARTKHSSGEGIESQPTRWEASKICKECEHGDNRDPNGRCKSVIRDPGGSLVYCGCECYFDLQGETCKKCGAPVADTCPTWWSTDDSCWQFIYGTDAGIRCIPCFTKDALAKNVTVRWVAIPES